MKNLKNAFSSRRRKLLLGVPALGLGAFAAPAVLAQTAWPAKSITLLVGFAPGGQTDFAGRILTGGMQTVLGQPVVIDNKAGVNGNIASVEVMKAPPDGYKLLVGNGGSMTIAPHVYKTIGIADPLKLTPIGVLLQSPLVLAVPASSPVKTYADFLELVKTKNKASQGIDYGSPGIGSITHVTMELLRERMGGPKMSHVPYKGSGPAMTDLISGRLDAMFDATSVVAPYIKSGQLRPLMVTSEKRVLVFPDVPTAAECGVKDFKVIQFIGLYGPPGLSPDIVSKVNGAINSALKDPLVVKGIQDRGDELGGGTSDRLSELTRSQFRMWGDVVKANNIQAD
ncbi:tripartite tricarboxylate transporter substrate binding protein [Variovorax ureilyticus]|uniref:Tripartite tricarboxylate transporter substrate binding protein n=1 Tax=Variovorax ureilyticus TaxID=1836198 RepID=A0ABU8VNM2_9BURK